MAILKLIWRIKYFIMRFKGVAFLLWFFALSSFKNVQAQRTISFAVGITENYLKANVANVSFTVLQPMLGYYVSAALQKNLTNKIIIFLGAESIQKNYTVVRTGIYQGIYDNHINNFIQLPITIQYIFLQKKILPLMPNWECGHVIG